MPLASPAERYATGKRLRGELPRHAQSAWTLSNRNTAARLRPIYRVNAGRLARLLPEKYRRMRASPFAFSAAPRP
jgi:hypothetical protein